MDAGIHTLSSAAYHADPAPEPSLSSSIAGCLISQSPLHAMLRHPRLNANYQEEESSRFDIGTAAHALLLERDDSRIVWVPFDDWRSNAAKELRDTARAQGNTPVLTKYQRDLQNMVAAAGQAIFRSELSGILETGTAETSVLWKDGAVWCRARPDLLSDDRKVVVDYKTTESAAPDTFIRQIGRMSYDLQAEWYTRGLTAVTGHEPQFVFLAQEITAPFACSLIALSNAYRAVGQHKVEAALKLWGQCMKAREWPAYSEKIHYAEPPAWALSDMIAKEF